MDASVPPGNPERALSAWRFPDADGKWSATAWHHAALMDDPPRLRHRAVLISAVGIVLIQEAFDRYKANNPALAPGSVQQIEIAVRLFRRATLVADLAELSTDTLAAFSASMLRAGRSPRTVNGKIGHLLTLWRWAYKQKHCTNPPADRERLTEPQRIPRAWTEAEMARLVAACDAAPRCRTWDGRHWRALVLTAYDTSLRITSLLRVPRSCLHGDRLAVPAELQKGRAETDQSLHEDTLRAIAQMPWSDQLFAWPYHPREIWRRFKIDVLSPAGLPITRRDMFHKLRRTSYTQVYARISPEAASRHAAHKRDMSDVYLDTVLLEQIAPTSRAVKVLPRPGQQPTATPSTDRLAELLEKLNERDRQTLLMLAERIAS